MKLKGASIPSRLFLASLDAPALCAAMAASGVGGPTWAQENPAEAGNSCRFPDLWYNQCKLASLLGPLFLCLNAPKETG